MRKFQQLSLRILEPTLVYKAVHVFKEGVCLSISITVSHSWHHSMGMGYKAPLLGSLGNYIPCSWTPSGPVFMAPHKDRRSGRSIHRAYPDNNTCFPGFLFCTYMHAQSCLTLCDPVDCSLPSFSVHGILQARILEWVTISFSRGSSCPRHQTQVSRIGGRRFNL